MILDSKLLILAGAGSGKTRVLTTRIAWLLQNGHASPGGILAVTFTNKAAKEMVTRLSAMLPVNVRGMWIGTFHGLCNRLLRAHHKAAGLPQAFQILDTQDQLSAIKRLCKQHNVDDERFPPKQLAVVHCRLQGRRPAPRRCEVRDERHAQEGRDLPAVRRAVPARRRGGLWRADAALLRAAARQRPHPRALPAALSHILVDEFQDTNKLQYAWLKHAGGHEVGGRFEARGSVMAVGDDDQSIYAFRGARVGNMADFVREFDVQHQIKLEQNYRSYSNILDSANALISHNSRAWARTCAPTQGAGEPVRVYEAPPTWPRRSGWWTRSSSWRKERWFRAQGNRRALPQQRAKPGDRTALFNASVPYRVYGGLRFFERAEIKHALAYLRLLENPNDDTSFCAWSTFRRAALARAASRCCKTPPAPPAARCTTR
jgi:DNA helicase-2/ATP-dependent DNA helicase PcrA